MEVPKNDVKSPSISELHLQNESLDVQNSGSPVFRKRHHSTPDPNSASPSHLRHRHHSFRGRISDSSGCNGSTSALVEGNESDSETDSRVEMIDTETITDAPPQQFDWEAENRKAREVFDDGNQSFFWQAHTVTCLVLFLIVMVYVGIFENSENYTSEYNMKRGVAVVVISYLVFGVIHTPDGPFLRPHPAFWRLINCLSVVYELAILYLLFQNVDDARKLLTYVDPSLGHPLPEKDYGGSCVIYDSERPDDPFHSLKDKMDVFVILHLFGWWFKALMIRDWWLCMVLSAMFEVMEYTLEHQLPNFHECWWDHWLLDFLICNTAGIYFGMKTCKYLSMRTYHWRALWSIKDYRGKMKRITLQFTPHHWTKFDWRPTSSFKRFVCFQLIILMFLLMELNNFYLKFVLWVPPDHFLVICRGFMLVFAGSVGLRETFQFMDDPNCHRFGRQSWLMLAILITEVLLICKLDWQLVTKPPPTIICILWGVFLGVLASYTLTYFYIGQFLLRNGFVRLPRAPHLPPLLRGSRGGGSGSASSGSGARPSSWSFGFRRRAITLHTS